MAKTNYVLLLSNDVAVNRTYLKAMVRTFESKKDAALISPRFFHSFKNRKAGALGVWGGGRLSNLFGWPVIKLSGAEPSGFTFMSDVCSVLLDKRTTGTPLFDVDYRIFGEDVYLSWKLLVAGYCNYVSLESVAKHETQYRKQKQTFERIFNQIKNSSMNVLLFLEFGNVMKVLPVYVLYIFLSLCNPRFFFWKLRAHVWIFKNFGKILAKRRGIQVRRKVSDRQLSWGFSYKNGVFEGLVGKLIDSLLYAYCWTLRLPVKEIYKNSRLIIP